MGVGVVHCAGNRGPLFVTKILLILPILVPKWCKRGASGASGQVVQVGASGEMGKMTKIAPPPLPAIPNGASVFCGKLARPSCPP